MNHDRVCLFSSGEWCWSFEYSTKAYGHLGEYKEIVVGQGWSDRCISNMLKDYYQENLSMWETQ